jgi:hypothetical protein
VFYVFTARYPEAHLFAVDRATGTVLESFSPGFADVGHRHSSLTFESACALLWLHDIAPGSYGPGGDLYRVDIADRSGSLELNLDAVTVEEPTGLAINPNNDNLLSLWGMWTETTT